METISTIITAYDHHELTVAHVKHAMDVSRIPDEIVVVNDGGLKKLKTMLKKLPRKCPITYARIDDDITWNYNGACNLGAVLSRGDNLAFEDNDNIPSFTFYENALQALEDNPKIGRIQATKRKVVPMDDILNKPRDEWAIRPHPMGPNMGTAIIRRSSYWGLKGHDERLCGRYGWMYYDWRSRMISYQGGKEFYTKSVDEYFYVNEGQSGLQRNMDTKNRSIYVENARRVAGGGSMQPPEGILNFTYEYETWPRNTE